MSGSTQYSRWYTKNGVSLIGRVVYWRWQEIINFLVSVHGRGCTCTVSYVVEVSVKHMSIIQLNMEDESTSGFDGSAREPGRA